MFAFSDVANMLSILEWQIDGNFTKTFPLKTNGRCELAGRRRASAMATAADEMGTVG